MDFSKNLFEGNPLVQKVVNVRITLTEEALGTSPSDAEVYDNFIGSKAPDAMTRAEEIEAFGVGDVAEKGRTIFQRLEDGTPYVWNYQWRGFFKEAAVTMCELAQTIEVEDPKSGKIKKKKVGNNATCKAGFTKYGGSGKIDRLVMVNPRKIPVVFEGGVGDCQRPLRANTMQGPRTALASSDTVPAGAVMEFQVALVDATYYDALIEWLYYGQLHGFGQWRNSGKGTFEFEVLDEDGNVLVSNKTEDDG